MVRLCTTRPTANACLACRGKHVKCDGQRPVCGRCSDAGLNCTFVASRRGINLSRCRHLVKEPQPSPSPSKSSTILNLIPKSSADNCFNVENLSSVRGHDQEQVPQAGQGETVDNMIMLYYNHVHPSHPFLLPSRMYLHNPAILPPHLKSAMHFIASHFTSTDPAGHRRQAEQVFTLEEPEDVFQLQSLILLSITSFARYEREEGGMAMSRAIQLASMVDPNAGVFGQLPYHMRMESWRRTMCELHTLTALAALFVQSPLRFSLCDDMQLPCPDEEYESCQPTPQRTLRLMEERFLLNDARPWSSFAYVAAATRILQEVLDLNSYSATLMQIDALEASIANFILSVPAEQREFLENAGQVDELMLASFMLISFASINLHLPRSGLSATQLVPTICSDESVQLVDSSFRSHQALALRSANMISRLITTRGSLSTLSPCFTCGLGLAATVQLPAYIQATDSAQSKMLKQYIQLAVNSLNALGETWPAANIVRAQVIQCAREAVEFGRQRNMYTNAYSSVHSNLQGARPDSSQSWLNNLAGPHVVAPAEGLTYGDMLLLSRSAGDDDVGTWQDSNPINLSGLHRPLTDRHAFS